MNAGLPPGPEHIFGTDALGRDLFLRTLKGISTGMTVGIGASFVSGVIAVIAGFAAAGNKALDSIISWITDLVMSVPHTVLVIMVSFVMGGGLKGIFTGIVITHWCSLARLIRGEVLSLKTEQYTAISKKLGKSTGFILINHFLPHLVPQFITGIILLFPHAVLHEASVSFLGFGLPPENPSIGIILSESMRYLSAGMWWPAFFPGLLLVIIVLSADRTGENLRKILDPASSQE